MHIVHSFPFLGKNIFLSISEKIQSISGEILWASGDQGIGAILLSMKIISTRHKCSLFSSRSLSVSFSISYLRILTVKLARLLHQRRVCTTKITMEEMHKNQTCSTYKTGFSYLCNCFVWFAALRNLFFPSRLLMLSSHFWGFNKRICPLLPLDHSLFAKVT